MEISSISIEVASEDKKYGLGIELGDIEFKGIPKDTPKSSILIGGCHLEEGLHKGYKVINNSNPTIIRNEITKHEKYELQGYYCPYYPYNAKFMRVIIKTKTCGHDYKDLKNSKCEKCKEYFKWCLSMIKEPRKSIRKHPCENEKIIEEYVDVPIPELPKNKDKTICFSLPVVRKNGSGFLVHLHCHLEGFTVDKINM